MLASCAIQPNGVCYICACNSALHFSFLMKQKCQRFTIKYKKNLPINICISFKCDEDDNNNAFVFKCPYKRLMRLLEHY